MTERYLEVSCDVCGEPDWVEPGDTLKEWKERSGWRIKGRKAICNGCWDSGCRWKDATLYEM